MIEDLGGVDDFLMVRRSDTMASGEEGKALEESFGLSSPSTVGFHSEGDEGSHVTFQGREVLQSTGCTGDLPSLLLQGSREGFHGSFHDVRVSTRVRADQVEEGTLPVEVRDEDITFAGATTLPAASCRARKEADLRASA